MYSNYSGAIGKWAEVLCKYYVQYLSKIGLYLLSFFSNNIKIKFKSSLFLVKKEIKVINPTSDFFLLNFQYIYMYMYI